MLKPFVHEREYYIELTKTQVSALVGVNKALVGPKNLRNQFETIHLQRLGIENAAKISEQDLKRSITAQYITTYGDWQQLSFLTETIAMLQREQLLLKTLTERNVYRQTDYLTFLVTLQQQELAVKQANIQFQSNYATLNYLCGITDTGTVALQEPPVTLATLPSEEHSVFFQQYMLDSLKLVNQRATLDFSYKPRLNVIADAGYNSSLADLPYKNFGTSIGLGLVVPIYDGKQRKLLRNKIAIAEDTRAHYRSFFLKQFNQQIAQLIQQLKATQELISDINTQIRYSDGLIQANRKLLVTGDARIADWVIAINNYLSARNLLTQNTVARWQIINQINYWNR